MSTATVYLGDIQPRHIFFSSWEKQRNKKQVHWVAECIAEMLGVFIYVYAGLSSVTGFQIGTILKIDGLSSIYQIGFAYAVGILLACVICGSTSGAHFNPCITIAFVLLKGFPPLKAIRYIFSQILGAYLAALVVYVNWRFLIQAAEAALASAGTLQAIQFTSNGVVGIFAFFLQPGQTLGLVFVCEFVTDTFLGLLVWACLDPANLFCPPTFSPVAIALGYGLAVWSTGIPGIALNTARDVGGRMAAMTIWGWEARGGRYSAITALTNIVGMVTGATLYELFFYDSDRVVPAAGLEFGRVLSNHKRLQKAKRASRIRRQSRQIDLLNVLELRGSETKPTEFDPYAP